MSLASVSRGHAVVAAAVCLALTSMAWADEAGSNAGSVTGPPIASTQPTGPLLVFVEGQAEGFDKASLQESLARELGREVTLIDDAAAAAVRVHLAGAHAEVQFTSASGEQLSRSVDLPPDRKRAVQVVSWLTVNLVRDEATELLDELRARRKGEAEARAAEQAAADKALADKAAADKAAADKAAAEAARPKLTATSEPKRPNDGLLRDPLHSFDATLVTPFSLVPDSPKRELRLQLALAYGDSGGLDGLAASLGALRVRQDLLGIAVGVGAVFVGGNARGVIATVGYAQLDNDLEGILLGTGGALQRGGRAKGVVASAGGALANDVEGALLGGGFATSKSLRGIGMSAGANIIRGPSEGVLIGAGVNWSAAHRGIEVSGGVNTARDLAGVAIAPINVHRRVKGLQVGIINVAEEVDAAIGLISVVKNGRVQPLLWTSIDGSVHLAIKSVAGLAFTQLGAGVDLASEKLSYDGGIGLHLLLGKGFFLEPGVHYTALLATTDASGAPDQQRLLYLAELGWRVGEKLDLLVGAGARHTVIGGSPAAFSPEARVGIGFF